MLNLTEQTAKIFRVDDYDSLTLDELFIFLNIKENYQDATFRKQCWLAGDKRCIITQEKIDLYQTAENTNEQHHKFGNYLSIEHIDAQATNKQSNYIENFIPIKGNLNSSINTDNTKYYLKHTLGWGNAQLDAFDLRVEKFRKNLFSIMKKYYADDVFIKFDKEDVQRIVNIYKLSSYTNNINTHFELAKNLGIEGKSPKREVLRIAKAFGIKLSKKTKCAAAFEIEYEKIKQLLETGHDVKFIAQKFKIKPLELADLIENDEILSKFESAESVNENRVINICETNSDNILRDYKSGCSVKWICDNYHMQRDHSAVKMFIHMKLESEKIEKVLEKQKKKNKKLKTLSDLVQYTNNCKLYVTEFNQDVNNKEMIIKASY